VLAAAIPLARAQNNYEIQVYGADTVAPRTTMVELHSNFTADGQKNFVGTQYPDNHAEHETIEITQGINDWSEVGFYIFTSERSGQACSGWATICGRACGSRKNGAGRWASASPPKSVISARAMRPTRGTGRFDPSSTRPVAAGIGPSIRPSSVRGMGLT